MTQLNKGTYLPSGVLTHILSYCGDDFKTQHQKQMSKIINDFTQLNKIHHKIMNENDPDKLGKIYNEWMNLYAFICWPAESCGCECGPLMDIMNGYPTGTAWLHIQGIEWENWERSTP